MVEVNPPSPTGEEAPFQQAVKVTPNVQPAPDFRSQATSNKDLRARRNRSIIGRVSAFGTAALVAAAALGGGNPAPKGPDASPATAVAGEQNSEITAARQILDRNVPLGPGQRFVKRVIVGMLHNEVPTDKNRNVVDYVEVNDRLSYYDPATGIPVDPIATVGLGTEIDDVLAMPGGQTPFSAGERETVYITTAVKAGAKDIKTGQPITDTRITIAIPETFAHPPIAP